MKNWLQEKSYLDQFCELLGFEPDECKIVKPQNESEGIKIIFPYPLNLEKMPDFDDSEPSLSSN